ncbi:Hypothetical predicted protein [Podarcis lilfordi]|uniref:Uncharacterized protein n=1 Tax=Podarcis lilfordi TaxID=74358 RepID=A0AA35KLZ0_9SAUR|nr:Hypothetical predicted protein [Podarcis lilfordi]
MHCEFRDLDDALMDRIVCGVRDIHLQRRLLAKPDLTLQKAIEEAVASEAAEPRRFARPAACVLLGSQFQCITKRPAVMRHPPVKTMTCT